MKILTVFALIISIAFAARLSPKGTVDIDVTELEKKFENVQIELPQEMMAEIMEVLKNNPEKMLTEQRAGTITAIINDYADKIFENIRRLLIELSIDPYRLPEETLGVLVGSIDLTNGWLQELATIGRGGDLSVEYSTDTRAVKFNVPVKFDTLLFTYDYKTTVLLLSISGGVDGNIRDVTADVVISFNFETLYASLEKMDLNAGKISVHFTGNGLVDWLTNAMTAVVTTFLKGLIMAIVESVLETPAEKIIDLFNSIIDQILHATTTTPALVANFM